MENDIACIMTALKSGLNAYKYKLVVTLITEAEIRGSNNRLNQEPSGKKRVSKFQKTYVGEGQAELEGAELSAPSA